MKETSMMSNDTMLKPRCLASSFTVSSIAHFLYVFLHACFLTIVFKHCLACDKLSDLKELDQKDVA